VTTPYVRSVGEPGKYPVEVANRRHTARVLTRLGHSAADIARRLGITNRTVMRYRALEREGRR
jgi:hypothetical protein